MHDPMTAVIPGETLESECRPAAPNRGDQQRNLLNLVTDVQTMAQAMQARLMVNGKLKDGIAIREGKEAVSSISSLLSLILRNKDSLEDMHFQLAFDNAVVEVLDDMDSEHKTDYSARLQEKLNSITL